MGTITSPCLTGIQGIPGFTPAQKHQQFNSFIKQTIDYARSSNDGSYEYMLDSFAIPKTLQPLVRLEVARALKGKAIIAEALLSDDPELVSKALRTPWFFESSNKEYINPAYFRDELLPFASLDTRRKILKNLVASFNAKGEAALADEFYNLVTNLYGRDQAKPLLQACSEDFIWNEVSKEKVVLSNHMVKGLFLRYPKLIIRYLKLSFQSDSINRYNFHLNEYAQIFPRLIKKHSADLLELWEAETPRFYIKLSKRSLKKFMKINLNAILERPLFFTQKIQMSCLAEYLTKNQYKVLFANVFPKDIKKYSYLDVEYYLRYYPKDEKVQLLLETYEQVYGRSMLENPNLVTSAVMEKLPVEQRVQQARVKLQKDDDWRKRWKISEIWRCYLPKDEVLPLIKTDITKSSLPEDRSCLLSQMIFVCSLNDDKPELLRFLQYFTTRHRNENQNVIYEVMNMLSSTIKLETLSQEHWNVIEEFLKFLDVKNVFKNHISIMRIYLIAYVHYKLKNNLPIEEQLRALMELGLNNNNYVWCILPDHPEYDKICLEKFIEMLPEPLAKLDKKYDGSYAFQSLIAEIYSFNDRMTNKYKKLSMYRLTLRNYKWLFEKVKQWIKTENPNNRYIVDKVKRLIERNEPTIYKEWFPPTENLIASIDKGKARKLLKNYPNSILSRIHEYFEAMKKYTNLRGNRQLFVKACRWYQDIPMKLFALCLENLQSDENRVSAILILAVLVESSIFVQIVEPFLPEDTEAVKVNDEKSKAVYQAVTAIARGMNLARPPVPLSFVAKICNGDFLSLGLISLFNVSRRTSVRKVENFGKKLSTCRISVKKHGIRLYCSVATIDDYRSFLTDLWKTETHRSIRVVIFTKIHQLFISDPSLETWKFLEDCISSMTVDDNDFLESIVRFEKISLNFLPQYIPLVWQSFERLREQEFDKKILENLTVRFFQAISGPMCKVLPDEFSEMLFKTYFRFDNLSEILVSTALSFTLNGYLRADKKKIEVRLQTFSEFLINMIQTSWDSESPIIGMFYPTKWLLQRFVCHHLKNTNLDDNVLDIMYTMQNVFDVALQDVKQIYRTYTYLHLGVAFGGNSNPEELAEKFKMYYPLLVTKISPGLFIEIASIINDWIDRLVKEKSLHNETRMRIIRVLIDCNNEENWILAAKLLSTKTSTEHELAYRDVFMRLQNSEFPVAASIAREYLDIREMPIY